MTLWNLVGSIGACAIILAYGLLQLGRWKSGDPVYSACNAVGSGLILLSLVVEPNWPSILIEGFWLLISVAGLLHSLNVKYRAGRKDAP